MKRYMERLNLKDESGATVVIVALFMVVLLGFAALAIDGGRLYLEKSELQKALDAAVLAGAQEFELTKQSIDSNRYSTKKWFYNSRNVQLIGNSIQSHYRKFQFQ